MGDALAVVGAVPKLALEVARERGADPVEVARRAGVDIEAIDAKSRVPRRVELAVWRAASDMDPDVGIVAAAHPELTARFGLLGFLARSTSSVLEALQVGAAYHGLVKRDVHVSVDVRSSEVELVTAGTTIPSCAWPRAALDFSVIPYVTLTRAWAGAALRPLEVHSTAARPSRMRAYDRILDCPIRFEAKRNAIVFARDELHVPLRSTQPDLAVFLRELADTELASAARVKDPRAEVHTAIARAMSRGGPMQLPAVARSLGVSARTLQRRLAAEGTDFARVLDEVRADAAVELLRAGDLGFTAIADRVGFADAKSLRRAFVRWFGKRPSDVRRDLES